MPWNKIPFLSLFIAILLLLSYLHNQQHDTRQWQSINKIYQQALFDIEAPIYLDYVSRRLNIERIGSPENLSTIDALVLKKDTLALSRIILQDNDFYQYVTHEGHLFLEHNTLQHWQAQRHHVSVIYQILSSQRFGISPDQFKLANIITHPFVSQHDWVSVVLILSFLLIAARFEYLLGPFKLTFYLLLSCTVSSLSYHLLSSSGGPVLFGVQTLIFGISLPLALLIHQQTKEFGEHRFDKRLRLSSYVFIALCLTSCLALIFIDDSLSLIHGISYLLAALCSGAVMKLAFAIEHHEPVAAKTQSAVETWVYRAELAKVMEFLSHFEFSNARQSLNALAKQYPDSRAILEQQYQLAKLEATDERYWRHAQKLVALAAKRQDYERIKRLFTDIQKNAASKKRAQQCLLPKHYHQMMMIFIHGNDLPRAEQAFLFLELGSDQHIIYEACQLLIQEFKLRHVVAKQRQYEMLLERLRV